MLFMLDKPKDAMNDSESNFGLLNAPTGSLLQFQPHQNISPTESSAAGHSSGDNNGMRPGAGSIDDLQAVNEGGTALANSVKPPPLAPGQGPTAQQLAAFLAQQQLSLMMRNQMLNSQQNTQQGSTRFQVAEKAPNHQYVSHSSVEKQRRDRINSLIDELRDLVPPQKDANGFGPCASSQGFSKAEAAAADARRPKHQVLADTISYLKALKVKAAAEEGGAPSSRPPLSNLSLPQAHTCQAAKPTARPHSSAPDVKLEGGSDDELWPNFPAIPHIPVQISSFAGVSVERAAENEGVMYVQVKCRDRRGLLSDIINALKALPLEVKTAAVVTSGEGTVRDVFEVHSYDPGLLPETIQNVVHDALYHQRSDEGNGKRLKSRS